MGERQFFEERGERGIPPIIPVHKFDQLLQKNSDLLTKIAGVSSVSWQQVAKGFGEKAFQVSPWRWGEQACVNLDLVNEALIFRGYYPWLSCPSAWETILSNRDYGLEWSGTAIYQGMYGLESAEQADHFVESGNLVWLKKHIEQHGLPWVKQHVNWGDSNVVDWAITTGFNSDEAGFYAFMDQLTQTRGVQIVYGGSLELVEFLGKEKVVEIDDVGVRVFRPIPGNLVLALVPLGETDAQNLRVYENMRLDG